MSFIQSVFSVKNNRDKTHKIITFLGIKIKIKKKFDKNAKTNNFGIIKDKADVVILGNGPSLKESFDDPKFWEFIKNKDVIGVNSFPVSKYFFDIKPKYLAFMDPNYWCKNLIKEEEELIKKTIINIKKATWDICVFIPKSAQKWNWFKDLEQHNNIEIVYINTQDIQTNNNEVRFINYKTNNYMPSPQNVLIACVYCSINIGYKNIYIFGADHTWHLFLHTGDDNHVYIRDSHFYDKKEAKLTILCNNTSEGSYPITMREIMRAYMIVYEKYEVLEKYSKYMGSKIYNMSKISCIDAFERKKLEDV